jgi:tetratricopeptide (TPR) repeat protein
VLALELHGALKIFLLLIPGYSIFHLFIDLIPAKNPIKLHNGEETFNDGQQLVRIIKFKRFGNLFFKAAQLYDNQSFKEAGQLFERTLTKIEHEDVFRLAISAYLHSADYEKALEIHKTFATKAELNSNDLSIAGLLKSKLKMYQESLQDYDLALYKNPQSSLALNNRGFTYNLLEKYEKAIEDFNYAIELEPLFAYAYNNRGLAKIKTGQVEAGLEDIFYSFHLDPQNAYAYRNLGIYHLDRKEFDKALNNFNRAKELDHETVDIESLIEEAKNHIPQV